MVMTMPDPDTLADFVSAAIALRHSHAVAHPYLARLYRAVDAYQSNATTPHPKEPVS